MIHYVCSQDIIHNGTQYRKGQAWDGDFPAPQVGDFWSILQQEEPDSGLQHDGIVTSSSRGGVGWKKQPDRVRAQPLTPEEKQQLEIDPYADLDGPVEAAPPPPAPAAAPQVNKNKPAPVMSDHLQMTQEDLDDPFGLRARAAAQTAELKEDSPVDPPEE